MLLHPRPNNAESGFGPNIPKSFSSLEEARNSLDFHWNGCLRVQAKRNLDNPLEMTNNYPKIFQQWSAALHVFLEKSASSFDPTDVKGAAVLGISHRLAAMHFDKDLMAFPREQIGWDKYRAEHEEMVSLAAAILEASPSTPGAASIGAPSFSIDMNIIAPLYSVAHRCRDPYIRRKAISVLYAVPRQEGIWNSILSARVAQRVMEIEEVGLGTVQSCFDVPEWAGISDVDVHFDLESRQATIKYCRRQSALEKAMETVTDIIQW